MSHTMTLSLPVYDTTALDSDFERTVTSDHLPQVGDEVQVFTTFPLSLAVQRRTWQQDGSVVLTLRPVSMNDSPLGALTSSALHWKRSTARGSDDFYTLLRESGWVEATHTVRESHTHSDLDDDRIAQEPPTLVESVRAEIGYAVRTAAAHGYSKGKRGASHEGRIDGLIAQAEAAILSLIVSEAQTVQEEESGGALPEARPATSQTRACRG